MSRVKNANGTSTQLLFKNEWQGVVVWQSIIVKRSIKIKEVSCSQDANIGWVLYRRNISSGSGGWERRVSILIVERKAKKAHVGHCTGLRFVALWRAGIL